MNKEFEIMTNNILLEQGKNKKYRFALIRIKELVEAEMNNCKHLPCWMCKKWCNLQQIRAKVDEVLDYE